MLGVSAHTKEEEGSLKNGHLHRNFPKDVKQKKLVNPLVAAPCGDRDPMTGGGGGPAQEPLVFPLSPRQERMYFMQQAHPDSRAFNVAVSIHLQCKDGHGSISPVHLEKLTSVLETIISRHNSLRVSFQHKESDNKMELQLVQTLHPASELKLYEVIPTLPESSESEAIHTEVCRPLDLTKKPFRFSILRFSKRNLVLVMTIHHIVTDGVSVFITMRELLQLLRGEQLEPAMVQFNHLLTSRPLLTSSLRHPAAVDDPKKKKKLDKWIDLFSSATSCTSFLSHLQEFDHTSATTRPFTSDHCYIDLSRDITSALNTLSHSLNASPVVVLSAVFSLALHSLTQTNDIIIGMVNANRNTRSANVLGYLVNTLPLRVDLTASYSRDLKELVRHVRRNWSMVLDGDIDLGDLIPLLPCLQHTGQREERCSLEESPLQVFFSYYSVSGFEDLPTQLTMEGVEFDCHTEVPRPNESHANLLLEFNPSKTNDQGLPGFLWEYQTRALNGDKIRVLHSLVCGCLLEAESRLTERGGAAAIVDPRSLMASLAQSLSHETTAKDKSYSIARGTPLATAHHRLRDDLVYIQWFEEVAREHPTSPAFRLKEDNSHLTFSQVRTIVSHLAVMILEVGVGPGHHVALYLKRTPLLYLCVLAVLKCAAGYVCLALQNSPKRCAKLVELAQTKLVITESALLDKLPSLSCPLLTIDPSMATTLMECRRLTPSQEKRLSHLETCYSPSLPFYLIFTSGTTGEPKVVVITNGNMQATLHNYLSLVSPQETRVTLASCNLSFDGHIVDSLAPLLNGGCLVVTENITRLDGGDPYMVDVTALFSTPSAAALISYPLSLRLLLVGGEAMSRACLQNTMAIHRILNMYGPSECTVFATVREVSRSLSLDELVVSEAAIIGQPLPNVELFVLDDSMQPVPVNYPGILYISGPIVSDVGYYRDPRRTERNFIRHSINRPVGSSHPSKEETVYMYNTGDWVCMLPDGNFKFLGRKDDQVKLRGMRFQLLEVEKALSSCPGVKSAITLVTNPGTSSATLVGYVTPRDVERSDVLSHLGSLLPSYMVPSLLVPLDRFPLTKEGKVDRRALKDMPLSQMAHFQKKEHDSESVLMKLTKIFGRCLQIDDYPVDGNFFAHGGHSLLCFQLMRQVNQELGVRLNLTHILQQPTPQGLANHLSHRLERGGGTTGSKKEKTEMKPTGKTSTFPHSQPPSVREERSKDHHVMRGLVSEHLQRELAAIFNSSPTSDEASRERVSTLLAQETGYDIPGEKLCHYSSVEMLEVHLELRNTIMFRSTPQLVTTTLYPPSSPTDTPIFFLHGGTIWWGLAFTKLAHTLKVYSIGVQCSQEASQQPTLEELCAFYLKHIQAIQPHGPYRLAGYCFGSFTVYELIRQLSELGERVDLAVMIDNSPMIAREVRPLLFTPHGQPSVTSPMHPYHYYRDKLMVDLSQDGELKALEREGVTAEEMVRALLTKYHWLPFTPEELVQEYQQSFSFVKKGMLLYQPQPIAEKSAGLVKHVLLFRNRKMLRLFRSHDYGLKEVVREDSLSVIISPHDLLLDDGEAMTFVSSVIKSYTG